MRDAVCIYYIDFFWCMDAARENTHTIGHRCGVSTLDNLLGKIMMTDILGLPVLDMHESAVAVITVTATRILPVLVCSLLISWFILKNGIVCKTTEGPRYHLSV